MTEKEIRAMILARTMLFNYGQMTATPHSNYLNLCYMVQLPPKLLAIPEPKQIQIQFTFFTKSCWLRYTHCDCDSFVLCHGFMERLDFAKLGHVAQLSWYQNFHSMQQLLFCFETDLHYMIGKILRDWNRPHYDPIRIPFQIA